MIQRLSVHFLFASTFFQEVPVLIILHQLLSCSLFLWCRLGSGCCGSLILALAEPDGRMISAPTKPLSTVIGSMKRAAARRAGIPLWQKSFHDHVIRGEADYRRIWNYIDANPRKWREDCYYV